MTNTKFFKGLPEFDDSESISIIDSDRNNLLQLSLLLQEFNWHEKMAIGLIAYHQIDATHRLLIKLSPAHGEFSAPIKQALDFVQKLSPQALAELAEDILQEHFEGEIESAILSNVEV